MARYRKVDPRIWNDEKFRVLSDDGKLAFLFVLTHPQMTALGAMRATIAGLAAEIGWSPDRMRDAIGDAIRHGMVVVNRDACFIGLPKFLKYNEPEGPNSVTKAWIEALDLIPECPEKRDTIVRCRKYLDGKSHAFRHAIGHAIWDAFAMPCPIQEQEQEQEQEQDVCRRARGTTNGNPKPVTNGNAHDAADSDFAAFQRVKDAYPRFLGRQDWIAAEHYCHLRLDEGETWESLEAAVRRYAAYVAAGGVSGPRYVMTPAKFFSAADRPWTQPWDPPAPEAPPRARSRSVAARITWHPDDDGDELPAEVV